MIDTSKAKWALSKEEKFAIDWFAEHGFSGTLEKQYIKQTVFTLCKDGLKDTFLLPQGISGINTAYIMEEFEKYWLKFIKMNGRS